LNIENAEECSSAPSPAIEAYPSPVSSRDASKALGPVVTAALAGLAFINVAKFLEIVMRSQHRAGINNHGQPVIWVFRGMWCKTAKQIRLP
jgi:hypothetical protein